MSSETGVHETIGRCDRTVLRVAETGALAERDASVSIDDRLAARLVCPRCRSALQHDHGWYCSNGACEYNESGFPSVSGRPALIDFADSIIDRGALLQTGGASTLSRASSFLRTVRDWAAGGNDEAAGNCLRFVERCRAFPDPNVLVIGGGEKGAGTEGLYAARDLRVVGTDIYASPNVEILSDGHSLPFADASFHGIWIQAVLEHVVVPERVVSEINRVLVDGGLVYAETPFLQPVHEQAYDFTRFTRSGHRWLFRGFAELRSGTIGGPGASLVWSIRYFARSLFRNEKMGSLFAVAFFWLRFFDRFIDDTYRSDAAAGVFFLGTKTDAPIKQRDLVAYFPGAGGSKSKTSDHPET